MDVPGAVDALNTPQMREKAEKRAETLLAHLKESVQAEVKDIGVLRKSLRVTVPAATIGEQVQAQFDDISTDAVIPGFRRGRAPRSLIQKRFGGDVKNSLKTTVLGQSYFAAIEKTSLQVLGDPLFSIKTKDGEKLMDIGEAMSHVELPEDSDFSYQCEVEVKPEIKVPELKGVEVKSPKVEITDAMVDEGIERQLKIRGKYEKVEGEKATDDDMLMADVALICDGKEVKREANLQLGVRPTRLDGITLMDLGKKLKGAKVGDHVESDCVIPDDYERADLRGKKALFKIEIHELKRLRPLTMAQFVEQVGARDEKQVREFARDDLEAERDSLAQRAMREQVLDYLLENVELDVPEKLSARQTDRAVMRAVVDLYQRGLPQSDIEAKIDELRTAAKDTVVRELKLEFILEKVSESLDIKVSDEELNTEIARIARRYNRRFDRVRDDLQREGLLMQLANQIRQDKAARRILADAKVTEVTELPAETKAAKKPKAALKAEEEAKPAEAPAKAAEKPKAAKPAADAGEKKKAPSKKKKAGE